MLMTSQPIDEKNRDSARVEKRGPLTTTTVPVVVRREAEPTERADRDRRNCGQYGSAKETCVVIGPSKNVSLRPLVKSIN